MFCIQYTVKRGEQAQTKSQHYERNDCMCNGDRFRSRKGNARFLTAVSCLCKSTAGQEKRTAEPLYVPRYRSSVAHKYTLVSNTMVTLMAMRFGLSSFSC